MRVLGFVIAILGALALAYQGFSFVTMERVVDAGPLKVDAERWHTVWIPPVVAAVAVVAGLIMIATGGRRDTVVVA